jgi:hypothetical protein
LGLHPIVYFYSNEGRYRTVSFLAVVDFVINLDRDKQINNFIKVREDFEKFILEYDYMIKQIYEKHRDVHKSYKYLSRFFKQVITYLEAGKIKHEITNEIISTEDFKYLTIKTNNLPQPNISSTKDFNTDKKSEIYIKDVLQNAPRCKICNGLIHRNSISIDHIQRKEDGGLGTLDNGQITHPYCNTGYKN